MNKILPRLLTTWIAITALLLSQAVLAGYQCAQQSMFAKPTMAIQSMAKMADCETEQSITLTNLCQAHCEKSASLDTGVSATVALPMFMLIAWFYPTSENIISRQPLLSAADAPPLIAPALRLQYQVFLI